jgi:hypothetical protein
MTRKPLQLVGKDGQPVIPVGVLDAPMVWALERNYAMREWPSPRGAGALSATPLAPLAWLAERNGHWKRYADGQLGGALAAASALASGQRAGVRLREIRRVQDRFDKASNRLTLEHDSRTAARRALPAELATARAWWEATARVAIMGNNLVGTGLVPGDYLEALAASATDIHNTVVDAAIGVVAWFAKKGKKLLNAVVGDWDWLLEIGAAVAAGFLALKWYEGRRR